MKLVTKLPEQKGQDNFQGDSLKLPVSKISIAELEKMVSNLEAKLEQARQFVGNQQEELAQQFKMIMELETKLKSASNKERQLFLHKLIEEKEKGILLETTLKGQIENLQKQEVTYQQYKDLLRIRKQDWKNKGNEEDIVHSNRDLAAKAPKNPDLNPVVNNNTPKPETTNENEKPSNRNKLSQRKGNGFLLGIILGISLTTIGFKLLSSSQPETAAVAQPKIEQKKTASQTITVTEVALTTINNSLEATGTVAAYESTPVMAQAMGLQITQVLADEGDFVQKGEVLVSLNNNVLKAELAQAQASVAQAEARLAELKAGVRPEELQRAKENVTFAEADVRQSQSDLDLARKKVERNRNLATEGAIARDRLDEILNEEKLKESTLNKSKARLREAKQQLIELQKGTRREVITQAQASLAEAKARVKIIMARLKDTQIVAPVSGKIATREAKVGDVTSNTKELFTIIENGRLELKVTIPETQLQEIRVGQSVNLTSKVDPNLNLTAKVREIEPTIDRDSRQATVNIDLPSNSNLKPGMFLQAEIITSVANALTIPIKDAFQPQGDNQGFVYLIQSDNTAKKQSITIGEILNDKQVEVKTGLKKGDRIAVKGSAYLKDGDKVNY